jgi:hypothetical protein
VFEGVAGTPKSFVVSSLLVTPAVTPFANYPLECLLLHNSFVV